MRVKIYSLNITAYINVVLRTVLSSYKSYTQMPAEFYGILSRLLVVGFTVFDLTRLEYTRSEKEMSVYRVRDSNKTPAFLTLKTAVPLIPVV